MRTTLTLLMAACVATAGAVGCSGDNSNPDGGLDGSSKDTGSDVNNIKDSGPVEGGDGGACNFAAFVIDLIDNHTTMTDTPSVDLGQNCVDNHDQSEFKPLFP